MNKSKKGLLERLEVGVVIGDGGYVFALEKRGYVKAGPWTPEVVIENPQAVQQLHREFQRAGSDVLQTMTFYSSDDKLRFGTKENRKEVTCKNICNKACQLTREVADEGDALVAGSISKNVAFLEGRDKVYIQEQVKIQADIFSTNKMDFLICEFFDDIVELEWTIEEAKKTGLPIVSSMCIGVLGDIKNVSVSDCAIRMAKAGADVVGINCLFDPTMSLNTIKAMKAALDQENLKPHLIVQANGFLTSGTGREGYAECPEFPYAMEPRTITRFDANKYAREAYEIGVRYIGGCCGFEPYHIRALSEELSAERGGYLPPASEKHEPWGRALSQSTIQLIKNRANPSHWKNLVPNSGRREIPTFELPSDV